jgi:beta-lactam-binding protein with PASTA domain
VAPPPPAPRATAPPPPPPAAGPPPSLINDIWPWLAALALLAVAGLLVWLFVLRDDSKGKVVPRVVGLQQQRAIQRLTGDGFGVRAVIAPSSKPRGIVFAQKPGAGSRLDKGQNVVIDVSNGHVVAPTTTASTTTTATTTAQSTTAQSTTTAQTTTTTATLASVPDVTGQAASDAAGQIEAAGFVAETEPVEQSGTAGSVVGEDPAGGAQAGIGSVVRLSVAVGSSRPAKHVPDVVGQKAAAARATLLDAGLTVKTVYKKAAAKSAGTVLAQQPAGGASQPAWSQITVTVAQPSSSSSP